MAIGETATVIVKVEITEVDERGVLVKDYRAQQVAPVSEVRNREGLQAVAEEIAELGELLVTAPATAEGDSQDARTDGPLKDERPIEAEDGIGVTADDVVGPAILPGVIEPAFAVSMEKAGSKGNRKGRKAKAES
jgi:hypothetical protein